MCLQNSKASSIGNRCHKLRPSEIRAHRGNHYWSSDSEAFTKPSLQHAKSLTSLCLREKYRLTNHTHNDIAGLRRLLLGCQAERQGASHSRSDSMCRLRFVWGSAFGPFGERRKQINWHLQYWSWCYARSKFPSSSVRSAVAGRSVARKSSLRPAPVFPPPETRLLR